MTAATCQSSQQYLIPITSCSNDSRAGARRPPILHARLQSLITNTPVADYEHSDYRLDNDMESTTRGLSDILTVY